MLQNVVKNEFKKGKRLRNIFLSQFTSILKIRPQNSSENREKNNVELKC